MYKDLLNDPVLFQTKNRPKVAELGIKAILFALIYYPLYLLGILTADDIRYWILTAFLIITGVIRFYRWLIRDDQNKALKDIEIREREASIREREIDVAERKQKLLNKK